MRIYIMRHGQAEAIAVNDKERALTEHGVQEVSQKAVWLKEQIKSLDCVLVSPYRRAQQTWLTLKNVLPSEKVIVCNDIVPNGSAEQVYDYICALILEYKLENLLVISHLPLVSFVLELLASDAGAPIFITAEVACIEFDPVTLSGELIISGSEKEYI